MAPIDNETMATLSSMIARALQSAIGTAVGQAREDVAASSQQKLPPFSHEPYQRTEGMSVADYFDRLEWALQVNNIPKEKYADNARVHMRSELNNAFKFLITPKNPEEIPYEELRQILQRHFDQAKNKFVESIKFRNIRQQKGETIAQFVLRLKQGAASCEYGTFLDRMLIEQMLHGFDERAICDTIVAKNPTTFKEAFDIAIAMEATHNTARQVGTVLPVSETTHRLGFEKPRTKQQQRRIAPANRNQQTSSESSDRPPNTFYESGTQRTNSCNGCGGQHLRSQCRFRTAKCNKCNRKGHIAKVCRSERKLLPTAQVQSQQNSDIDVVQSLHCINNMPSVNKKMLNVKINGFPLTMELDTGAPCGIISETTLSKILPKQPLQPSDRQFSSYTGHRINCIDRLFVQVSLGTTSNNLFLYVVEGKYDSLFGRDWIAQFTNEINFRELFTSTVPVNVLSSIERTREQAAQLSKLLEDLNNIFSDVPGMLVGPPTKEHLKPDTTPIFARARDVPLALRERYASEIDKKLASGFYEKVEVSEWASPTQIVIKKNGGIRITGNYKPTVNAKMIIDEHPIPKIEDIFNKMKGAALFCHLDVTDAYTHLPIDEDFRHILTLNTSTHGLIRPKRAVYGAANIPAIWLRRMETILQGLTNVVSFFDDVIVFAKDFEEMLAALNETLEQMRRNGLRLNRSKCIFATSSLECLGHRIDRHCLHKSDKHIKAIRDAPTPTTPEELQLFLDKATYYTSLIPNLSCRARPLRDVLLTDPFEWTQAAEKAYQDIKVALISPQVLMQYDPSLPLILATDASKAGLGAVLSHRLSNGSERPIAYASCTMSQTEQRYPMIDKEALAIVWAVKKFFHYLYARKFTLITDHKPLTQILHPEKSLPTLCISRMANYADYLAHFNFDIVYRPTNQNTNADYCSRIPNAPTENQSNRQFSHEGGNMDDEFDHFILKQIQQLPIRAEHIARETRKDIQLGKIIQDLEHGRDLARMRYKAPEAKYTLTANCLMFEHRVVIPASLRKAIMNDLHAAHIGIVKMKGLARSYVYWPGIDSEIEQTAKSCTECARQATSPPKFNKHHWEYPNSPCERIHIDYASPVAGAMLLVVVDAYSKWFEVKVTTSTTTNATISLLDELFAAYGAPVTVVSDNGPQFASADFTSHLKNTGVKYHKLTAPYHPATNGQAERYVQTVKKALTAIGTTKDTLQKNLNTFLLQYRKAPHTETGSPPAKLFLGRNIRTRIDLVRPQDINTRMHQKQQSTFEPTFRTFSV
uniref:uncharacterized protein K02A2.6-like n=1 Tax=Anopheles coluzzii TaxID=1518534 RepID=UPI0020FFE9CB|nr:uncharacterized protein K02A2.6-like [Anopheles coluzzii]XP_049462313.1 uncharacterized protein K02A2.6-like [Anopheles coluzzii]XP_049462317.1 uncharacterized protein K02A2.6-like [Anopheles coluzzii]XP_049462318.1 uncharacterized protein K02A2.6-like [Anopheles coluzzii]XP_049462319.1 uncharacterized protein K02A2.6-like [Anopheles coluzzii]